MSHSHGQVVKPSPFQGEVRGSIPLGSTKCQFLVVLNEIKYHNMQYSTSGLGRHPFKVVTRKSFMGSNPTFSAIVTREVLLEVPQ